jgi:predicted TIM-barrel fold metal-dependent hydrolase
MDLELISVDDHLLEPPALWSTRLPAALRERGPQLVHDAQHDTWVFDGRRYPVEGMTAAAGTEPDQWSSFARYDDMRPGFYDPVARLADMDADGVVASLCFPTFCGFSGRPFVECEDRELAGACLRAYNDFVCQEWAAAAPGRYIPLVLVPLWDARAAATEVERTAAMGAKAIAFSENPAKQGFPSIHDAERFWDPLFAAASETGLPLCMHIGSSSHMPRTAPDAHRTVVFCTTPLNAAYALADWLLSGVLVRFPDLELCLSEGGIGWIPYMVERADYTWHKHGVWTNSPLPEPPSTYFRRNVYGCFIDDQFGAANIGAVGVDRCMLETDYPHTDSSWPNSRAIAAKSLGHLTDDEVRLVTRGNAERVFAFTPSTLGSR